MFCTGCGTALAASDRFCPQCGRANAGAAAQAPQPPQPGSQPPAQFDLNQATAHGKRLAGQAEQIAGQAGQFLQGAQQRLSEQSFVQQAAAKLDQLSIPGLQTKGGTTSRDYIWSGVTLLVTLLGIWQAPLLLLVLALVVGAAAFLLGMRTGVSPGARAVAFTLAGGIIAFTFPADPIQLAAIALSARGAWGIVKELLPAEGPRLHGPRARYLWAGMGVAALGLCFQWSAVTTNMWVSFSPLTSWNEHSAGTNLYGLGQKMVTHTSTWGGENAMGYIFFLIGLGLVLYVRQGRRWTFGWQVGLTLLVWPLALVWMQGFTSYIGIGLIIYTIGIAVALRGLLGDRMPWPRRLQ